MAQPSEQLVQVYVDQLFQYQQHGVHEWVSYVRRDLGLVEVEMQAALEAGRRLGLKTYVDRVPDGYEEAPVRGTGGHAVIRLADTPAPWNRGLAGFVRRARRAIGR